MYPNPTKPHIKLSPRKGVASIRYLAFTGSFSTDGRTAKKLDLAAQWLRTKGWRVIDSQTASLNPTITEVLLVKTAQHATKGA